MAMVINSNIQSLNAQRHLNNSLDAQNTATERLSSGLRINSAKDDAAGLAIANRMTSQVQGLNQAVRNANDGAALIQTAEGGLEETTNILQRMRELSIQSANGTYDVGNRDTLNAEVEQLKQEIDRISETTSFNGLNVLDGSLGEIDLQVGENANQTIALNVEATSTNTLGGKSSDVVGAVHTEVGADLSDGLAISAAGATVTINNQEITGTQLLAATDLDSLLKVFSDNVSGVEVGAFSELSATATGTGVLDTGDSVTFTTLNADGTDTSYVISNTNNLQEVADKINKQSGGALTASITQDLSGNNRLSVGAENAESLTVAETGTTSLAALGIAAGTAQFSLTMNDTDSSNGEGITVAYSAAADAAVLGIDERTASTITGSAVAIGVPAATAAGDIVINGVEVAFTSIATNVNTIAAINAVSAETGVTADGGGGTTNITLTSANGKPIELELSANGATITGLQEINSAKTETGSVASIDITTAAGAQKAIGILDEAISEVSEIRGDLGAISNRLDYTTRNLSNISENAASARSAIMDADFAAESANLSRAQVLQQAGNAMLAQANSRPQQVLSLLQ
ncbi:MAG: flagellin [Oceanospirillaceae bacterium]